MSVGSFAMNSTAGTKRSSAFAGLIRWAVAGAILSAIILNAFAPTFSLIGDMAVSVASGITLAGIAKLAHLV